MLVEHPVLGVEARAPLTRFDEIGHGIRGGSVRRRLAGRVKVAVLDRNMSPGHSGIFAEEIRSALAGQPDAPPVHGYVLGIGGRDVRVETVVDVVDDLLVREVPQTALYVGVKGLPIGPARACAQIEPIAPLEVAR